MSAKAVRVDLRALTAITCQGRRPSTDRRRRSLGAHLVSLALVRWAPHVTDRAFRVLIRMAHTALDTSVANSRPAGVYFGGHELLALTLRGDGVADDAALKTVQRAVRELIDIGAVERMSDGRRGNQASYKLLLENAVKGDTSGPPIEAVRGTPADPHRRTPADPLSESLGDTSSPVRGTPADPPRNHEEPISSKEERWEEENLDLRTAVTVAREPAGKSPSKSAPKCSHGFKIAVRPDGESTCALCRFEEWQAA